MGDIQDIRDRIKAIAGLGTGVIGITGQVTKVNALDCSVMFGGLELTGVMLYSQATEAGNLVVKPKVGSMATVLSDPDMRDLQLIHADDIELIRFEENGLVIEYDSISGKVDIKNNSVSLKGLFQSVSDLIKNLKVMVAAPNSISGPVDPGTLTSVINFETSFKQLLK